MKPFNVSRICMPLLGLGAALALAPQSRAQEAAPDQFEIAPNAPNAVLAQASAATAKQPTAPAVLHAGNKKPNTHVTPASSGKSLSGSQKPEVVAVQDKRKIAARKPNN